MRKLVLIFIACGMAAGLAQAAGREWEGMTQQEMNQAAERDASAADRKLNAVYKKLMAAVDDEGKALLKTAQRAWINYRDAEAKFAEDEMRGGSAAPLLYFGALKRLTESRTKDLQESLEAFGENVAAP